MNSSGAEAAQASLRAAVLALRSPQAAQRSPTPTSSPYRRARATIGFPDIEWASEEALIIRAHTVETFALQPGTTLAVFLLPGGDAARLSLLRTAEAAASAGVTSVVLGHGLGRFVASSPAQGPSRVPLRPDDPIGHEWAMACCGPGGRAAFLAVEEPSRGEWEWLLTRDPVAAGRATSCLLERAPHLRLRLPPLA
jgi:hypothetical protein